MKRILFAVCETTYDQVQVEEKVPKCELKSEKSCTTLRNGFEKCVDYPRMACSLETETITKNMPNTTCKILEKPREICGPKPCPMTKMAPVCEDRNKMVFSSLEQHHMFQLQISFYTLHFCRLLTLSRKRSVIWCRKKCVAMWPRWFPINTLKRSAQLSPRKFVQKANLASKLRRSITGRNGVNQLKVEYFSFMTLNIQHNISEIKETAD